jgi:methyl-accepting chemotaxis protein
MIPPDVIAAVIGLIAVIGCICSLRARQQIRLEFRYLEILGAGIRSPEAWSKLGKDRPSRDWLRSIGVPLDSHAADALIAVRGGWTGGRLPTLGELHAMAARRERGRGVVRIASGIAATLLIFGIAGTLLGIHPLLTGFRIGIAADGTVQEASASANNVMSLVSGLGRAFLPSLIALFGTLSVVVFRGAYVHQTHAFSRTLDHFSADELLPAFHVATQEEVMATMRERLSVLAEQMEKRDDRFGKAVAQLIEFTQSLEGTTPELHRSIQAVSNAAGDLASNVDSVTAALERNFGQDSPVFGALAHLAQSSEEARRASTELLDSTELLKTKTDSITGHLGQTAEQLAEAAKDLPAELQRNFELAAQANAVASEGFVQGIRQTGQEVQAAISAEVGNISQAIKDAATRSAGALSGQVSVSTDRLFEETGDALVQKVADAVEAGVQRLEPLVAALELQERAAPAPVSPAVSPVPPPYPDMPPARKIVPATLQHPPPPLGRGN